MSSSSSRPSLHLSIPADASAEEVLALYQVAARSSVPAVSAASSSSQVFRTPVQVQDAGSSSDSDSDSGKEEVVPPPSPSKRAWAQSNPVNRT
jgi:hypothetical protein